MSRPGARQRQGEVWLAFETAVAQRRPGVTTACSRPGQRRGGRSVPCAPGVRRGRHRRVVLACEEARVGALAGNAATARDGRRIRADTLRTPRAIVALPVFLLSVPIQGCVILVAGILGSRPRHLTATLEEWLSPLPPPMPTRARPIATTTMAATAGSPFVVARSYARARLRRWACASVGAMSATVCDR